MENISTLAQRLQVQMQRDQALIAQQTKSVLERHERALKRLSTDVLDTTRGAIAQTARRMQRVMWMALLWPMIATMLLCALVIGGTVVLLPDRALLLPPLQTRRVELPDGRTAVLLTDPRASVCRDPSGREVPCIVIERAK